MVKLHLHCYINAPHQIWYQSLDMLAECLALCSCIDVLVVLWYGLANDPWDKSFLQAKRELTQLITFYSTLANWMQFFGLSEAYLKDVILSPKGKDRNHRSSRSCGCRPTQILVWGCRVFFRFIIIDFRIDEGDLLESWWIAYKTVERWLCHYMQVHWFESLSCRARWYPYCHHGGLFLSCYDFITGCSDVLRNFDRLLCRENALATIYVI